MQASCERVDEVSPADALAQHKQGALLLDVREECERATGMPAGAIGLAAGCLGARMEQIEPDRLRPILTLCGSGKRSRLAVETLRLCGYRYVRSVAGGIRRWKAEGLPLSYGALDVDAAERYARQLCLPQVGEAGQLALAAARVALIGAGGLGAPAALYLAAAGVGQISVIDDDRVERSNLQRQVIHTEARVGMAKTASACLTLGALNPRVRVYDCHERLQANNVDRLLANHDLVIDGSDNFSTRYLLVAASLRLRLPWVYGAVERFGGQVSVFDPRCEDSPCYRCLFAEPPPAAEAPNCTQAGVLGVVPGIVGLLQATEAIKLLLGLGDCLVGRLLSFDALSMHFRQTRLLRDDACPGCGSGAPSRDVIEVAHNKIAF